MDMIGRGIHVGDHAPYGFVGIVQHAGPVAGNRMKAVDRGRIAEDRPVNPFDVPLDIGRLPHELAGPLPDFGKHPVMQSMCPVAQIDFAKQEIRHTANIGQQDQHNEPGQTRRR